MKYFFYYILIFHILSYIFSDFQEWNFENASINLLTEENNYEYSYIIYNNTISNYEVTLTKNLNKNGNQIKEKNILSIINNNNQNEKYINNVEWEDIDSIIYYNNILHICPKGTFHPYYLDNNELYNHTIYNFPEDIDEWDLKCYMNSNLFIAIYTNNHFLYSYNSDLKGWTRIILDFWLNDLLWNQMKIVDDNNYYQLPGLTIYPNNIISLSKINLIIDFSIVLGIEYNKNLITNVNHNQYYSFFNGNNKFYLLSYGTNDIKSGYYIDNQEISSDNLENINPTINDIYEINLEGALIENMNILKGTRNAFYKIEYNNNYYYGIFDIITNQILFNTKEKIIKFIPFSKYSMLAITEGSAYEICPIRVDGKCIEKCDNDEIIINYDGSNYCKCSNFYFIPGYKCIDTCDLNIYTNDTNKCGLCKYLGGNKKYKLMNTTGCLEEKPANTIYYDEDSLLLICDKEYHLVNEVCVPDSKEEEEEKEESEKEKEKEKKEEEKEKKEEGEKEEGKEKEKEKEKKKEDEKEKKEEGSETEQEMDYAVWIFIGIVSFIFIIINILICKKICGSNKMTESDLLTQINTDFEPKDSAIN